MGKVLKFAVIILVVVGMAGVVVPAYSQDKTEQQPVVSVSAEIVSINVEKSTAEIKTIKDVIAKTYENQIISVVPETKIIKGDVALKLSDLKTGDKVTVQYATDILGGLKAEIITLEAA